MKYARAVGYFFLTVLIYFGLPLLGWGLGDLKGYFSNPARAGLGAAVALFGLAVGWQGIDAPEGVRGSGGEREKQVARQHIVRRVIVLMLYVLLLWLPFGDRHGWGVWPESQPARWVGLALAAIGMSLVFWSGLALGRMYSQEVTIQSDHHLITGGIYRYIRHPRYLGINLMTFGAALLFRSWIGLALAAAMLAVLVLRIRDEENLMRSEFGDEWERYCRRSWKMIPGVY